MTLMSNLVRPFGHKMITRSLTRLTNSKFKVVSRTFAIDFGTFRGARMGFQLSVVLLEHFHGLCSRQHLYGHWKDGLLH